MTKKIFQLRISTINIFLVMLDMFLRLCVDLTDLHSGKWEFEDYCSNKGLTFIKNCSAYFCPQLPVQLNYKSGRLL